MLKRRRSSIDHCVFFLSSAIVLLSLCLLNSASSSSSSSSSSSPSPSDELALLAFKSKADLSNRLDFRSMKNSSLHFCKWQGVTCLQQKVVRLVLQSLYLGGVFAPDTLTRLDQLRVLSLQNNSLTGSIPDLSQLVNLKSLYLDHNSFTGFFPRPILSLRRLRTIDFSYNNLTGSIPSWLANLDRLYYLRLEWNRFNGTVPSFNQSSLETFNVTGNNLTGAIPVTPTLLRFGPSSFLWNPGLCGEILNKECHPSPPFFGPTAAVEMASPPPTVALAQNAEAHGHFEFTDPPQKSYKQTAVVIGFSFGVFVLIGSLLCFLLAARKRQRSRKKSTAMMYSDREVTAQAAAVMQIEQENAELEEKVKKVQEMQVGKSGCLLFCAGEAHLYTLDQLMKASAELLGKGTMGTTYKAVMDNRLIVTVKRLDAVKLAGTNKEIVERHLESVGGLRHPNLVPLRAFFQAKEEKLLIYDYQPNGSLFSLIHGSKSTRAKPLHWTSCLKIAEDVAQGLAYIHQAWRLVHGNLKSSNVLLGADFEACLTDYCISVLAGDSRPGEDNDGDSNAYRSPETRNSMKVDPSATPKSDVYAFGILLAELLTGKVPSQHPVLVPDDMTDWVRSCREDGRGGEGEEDERMTMLVEVAIACSLPSPEQRPTMWQVLKMLQEIKETVLLDDSNEMVHPTGPSL